MKEETADEEHSSWDNLYGHGYSPRCCRLLVHVLVDAVIDPETNKRSNLIRNLEQAGENTADRRDGKFGDVARDSGGDATTCEASQDPSGIWKSGLG